MEVKKIEINGKTLSIPAYYQQVDSTPDDPEGSIPFMVQTGSAMCLALIYPISFSETVPRIQEELINGVSHFLMDNQGLVLAEADEEKAYSIVKSKMEGAGMQYILTYQRFYEDFAINIQGFFEEIGTTGIRDTTVYELCRRDGSVGSDKDPFTGWWIDPYKRAHKDSLPMNLSENEKYDEFFPEHPLSICREMIRSLIG